MDGGSRCKELVADRGEHDAVGAFRDVESRAGDSGGVAAGFEQAPDQRTDGVPAGGLDVQVLRSGRWSRDAGRDGDVPGSKLCSSSRGSGRSCFFMTCPPSIVVQDDGVVL